MKMTAIAVASAMVLVAIPMTVAANHPAGFSMPGASFWGLCNAYENNENGRENGNAGNASPFHWMQEQADENDQTVEEWCEQWAKPGGGNGGGAERGPPENRGRPN